MIHVIATITTHPGKREELLAATRANLPAVRAEPGCIAFAPVVDDAGAASIQTRLGDDSFVLIEQWSSVQALETHLQAPHMLAHFAATSHLVANAVVHVLSDASAG